MFARSMFQRKMFTVQIAKTECDLEQEKRK